MRWLPLESNPEVMNKYIGNLGASDSWIFHDVYGLDEDILSMVPRPVAAVLLLYPITEKSEAGQLGSLSSGDKLYFMKQKVGNACGTIGIIHALANSREKIELDASKPLAKFLESTKDMSGDERATALGEDKEIEAAHESVAQEGQSSPPDVDEQVNLHFVVFIHHNGGLYELDGRKEAPIRHGDTTPESLLPDAITVVRRFMERDPEELNFNLAALCKA